MDTIENIGAYLKQMREERNIPVAEVAQMLKTKPETIHAIESNEFGKIPAPTYVKGYLRSYANCLEIDAESILAEYNKLYPSGSKQVLVLQGQKFPRIGLDVKKILTPKILAISGGILIALLALILFITFMPARSARSAHDAKQQATEHTIPKKSPEAPKPPPTVAEFSAISLPVSLSAESLDMVWIRVRADGKLIFEGTLNKGETKNWQAQEEFVLRIGNPGKLNISINENPSGIVSPHGPVNVTINKDGVHVDK